MTEEHKCLYCPNNTRDERVICDKCHNEEEQDALQLLAAGICHIHLCSLLERYNEFEGGVSRYCPDCEELALGDIPF